MADIADARAALERHFGYPSFRPGQGEIIEAVLAGRDALAVMPTGAGKSVCYQVPAAVLPGLSIVVSPLISLMGDQVRALKDVGIRGSYLNSSLTARQQEVVMARAMAGWYDLMYVAPERLADPRFIWFASRLRVPLVAVDEAHCVSQWGQDFRPAYQGIADFVEALPQRPPVVALTATATERVRADIAGLLRLHDPLVQVTGFDRPNLSLSAFELTPKQRGRWIESYVRSHQGQSGIVYVTTRKGVDELSEALRAVGVRAAAYHAGRDNASRLAAQEAFVRDDVEVMVATTAFGMGIDKPDVRYVVRSGLPLSLEEYYQEMGRAGRDGEPAECYLLWSKGDIRTCHFFIDHTEFAPELSVEERRQLVLNRERLLFAMIDYARGNRCLRGRILSYFGQGPGVKGEGGCNNCSVCRAETAETYLRQRAATVRRRLEGDGELGGDDERLFQRLRALRRELADGAGVPAYIVFSDATLRAMARMRPHTPEELLEVPGVGEVKLGRYGSAFLDVLGG
ncbi:hypothetical protein ADJ70_11585 [Olsenella sp. oral taxon 807]|uniref:RecQ family ATP-dependent DNA helicase n=1 Tax=Olsenella sp. oral taxon 807 TaxID=712411 RepID=UPI000679F8C5|nr:ATP-dependent DNA helicase RecQ [Olsenella sp. oral taxon 807]AKT49443.1 hypothetical protein ADJ70_11585 [Olsenella sp. oral taxon 807]